MGRICLNGTGVRSILLCVAAAASCLIASQAAWADVADIEKDLQASLEQSRQQVSLAASKLDRGLDASPEIARLRTLSENIRITHLLLEERFKIREEKVKILGSSAISRQQEMAEGYRKAVQEYLVLVDSLPASGAIPQSAIRNLQSFLEKLLPKRKRPIIGSLPYKHLNLPAVETTSAPAITPAYKGGNKTVSTDDTAATPEAPISKEIAALAQSLNWNPVSIYEYVKNNVETEWYWGCMKGAEDTLHQKSGNDCDQATLLTALLRASGYPTRYVRGVIEFFPDIERAKNLTGIDDPAKIAEFFQKAGIPFKPVIAGGKIANFQIEHIWIETQVPYSNYRGSIIDEHGKAWLGLDTSIKVKGYVYNQPNDLYEVSALSGQLAAVRDAYLGIVSSGTSSTPLELNQTPLDYLQSFINSELSIANAELRYADFLRSRTLLPETMNILPASMQFTQVRVTNEYTAIPDELKHKVKLSAVSNQLSAGGGKLLEITLDVLKLSNQQITLSYEPETVEDQEIINSYGGLDNTPAYLVRLRPILKVNGERIVIATDGLPMGADYTLTFDLIAPSGTETINNTLIVGNLTSIGMVSQKSVSPQQSADSTQLTAEGLLSREAINYLDRWNASENELASLLHLTIARPLPTVVALGGMIDVTYLLDMPHGFTWKGVYVDADLRRIEAVSAQQSADSSGRIKLFMQLSGLQGSILENRIFEDDFKVESISTAKLIQISNQRSAVGSQLYTIDKANIDSVLPVIDLDDNIEEDIRNSVNQNMVVRLPQADGLPLTAITYHDWTGIGYLKENSATGESGWMLSGMIAGGSSVDAQWLNNLYLMQVLKAPYAGPKNFDPLSGAFIRKIPATDNQPPKPVDEQLEAPLAVAVIDRNGRPVAHANVTFEIIAGGGEIQCLDEFGNPIGTPSPDYCETQASFIYGVARANLRLGKNTNSNPVYRTLVPKTQPDDYPTQVGQNIVNASVTSHSGTLYLDRPFEQYGKPDVPAEIKILLGSGNSAVVNNPLGTVSALVADKHGNPVSNVNLTFDPTNHPPQALPGTAPLPAGCGDEGNACRNVEFYKKEECNPPYPLYGECTAYYRTITRKTDHTGAQVNAVAGNTVGTQYTVDIKTPGVATAKQISLKSFGQREDATSYIYSGILLGHLEAVDTEGHKVNAARAGKELKQPLSAKLYRYEDEITKEGPIPCTLQNQQTQCWNVLPTGIIRTAPVSAANVTFTAKEGNGSASPAQTTQAGIYLSTYTTGSAPAVNKITAEAEATIEAPEVYYDSGTKQHLARYTSPAADLPKKSITMKAGQIYAFDIITGEPVLITVPGQQQTLEYTAYGVGLTLDVSPKITLLDDNGYTTGERTFTYTIEPAEYNALSAYIDFYGANAQNQESWDGYITCDQKQGTGMEILSSGEQADPAMKHFAQLNLNWGTDIEIRGDKTPVRLAQLNVKTDEETPAQVDELKFSDGGKPNKRYKLELKSADLASSCTDATLLSGTIKTILKSGQTATAPGAGFNPTQYDLTFNPAAGGCAVKVNDKEKLIISNLSKTDLEKRKTDLSITSVLYGGLGNTSLIELSGARKEVPIEPVGVIVLAIDGIRQDVLYAPQNGTGDGTGIVSSYTDTISCGGSCYVEPKELKGLCDVLGGKYEGTEITDPLDPNATIPGPGACTTDNWENRHIKLPSVTAIFPSITFASWASIFTGKMPNETGIPGNEYFARDLYDPDTSTNQAIPGMGKLPSGFVSLDAGAFDPGGADFALNHVIPVEFKLFGKFDGNDTLTKKLNASAPNKALSIPPVWDSINTLVKSKYKTSEDADTRCDKSEYECRTVSILNQYTSGGVNGGHPDLWATPDNAMQSLLQGFTSWFNAAKIMDKSAAAEAVDFIKDYYSKTNLDGKRKRFPALFSVYLSGLDHDAHEEDLGGYKEFFKKLTDARIARITQELKDADEFDNKIFIVVADHGHTEMPTKLKFKYPMKAFDASDEPIEIMQEYDAETSCKLKLDFGSADEPDAKAMKAEQANNNLHIWELGTLFTNFAPTMAGIKLLAPSELNKTGINIVQNTEQANVIAALNGPMAHLYVKGSTWQSDPDETKLGIVIDSLIRVLSLGETATDKVKKEIGKLAASIDKILVRRTLNGSYEVVTGVSEDTSGNVVISSDALESLSNTEYIKVITRITGMNNRNRSGDIMLLMKDATLGNATNRYTTGVACKSWHGSLNKSDSYVPFVVAYPGGNRSELDPLINKVCPSSSCDGNWKITDQIEEILSKQY